MWIYMTLAGIFISAFLLTIGGLSYERANRTDILVACVLASLMITFVIPALIDHRYQQMVEAQP